MLLPTTEISATVGDDCPNDWNCGALSLTSVTLMVSEALLDFRSTTSGSLSSAFTSRRYSLFVSRSNCLATVSFPCKRPCQFGQCNGFAVYSYLLVYRQLVLSSSKPFSQGTVSMCDRYFSQCSRYQLRHDSTFI